jgi:ABC-2 type transport system ATP-binding protein
MAIEIQGITKLYGEQKALDNVSFSVQNGSIVGLLGPNGAGKSTLMKIITCFLPPTEGTVLVNDFDIHQQDIEVKKRVGYLPEHNPLYLEMYVREYLEFVAHIYRLPKVKKRVEEIIDITGLGIEQHKKIQALSKGYRQRIGLAQALIHDPEVLILDEPTSGLDPNQLLDIRTLIKEIGKTKTILFSTHIMQEVEALCDRVVIIDKGKIVADDQTRKVMQLSESKETIVVQLNGNINISKFEHLTGVQSVEAIGNHSWEITLNEEADISEEIFLLAKNEDLKVISLFAKEGSLENVFHQLTK